MKLKSKIKNTSLLPNDIKTRLLNFQVIPKELETNLERFFEKYEQKEKEILKDVKNKIPLIYIKSIQDLEEKNKENPDKLLENL